MNDKIQQDDTASRPVMRVARRRARPGCRPAYEALIRAMFADARQFPGFLGAELIPPEAADGDYQVVTKFAGDDDLQRWDASAERAQWHERLRAVAEGDPEFRYLTGMEAWFAPPPLPALKAPSRLRMTLATWLGIFPTVALYLWFVAPWLAPLPFLLRTAILTALVVPTMTYLVMPRLTRWLRAWLTG